METPTQPLREEHRELLPRIQQLRVAADRVGEAPIEETQRAIDEAYGFLVSHLIPHAQAEDSVLYPMVEQVMQAPGATATMRRDHDEVIELTRQLQLLRDDLDGPPTSEQRRSVQRVLYGLYAVIRLHFAKEEELYLPLLDAGLRSAEATEMFRAMHESAHPSGSADHEPTHH